ncbi:hypothetical protein CMEL01_00920 [Colletotrichum melonis]|uniref:Uncharacterized protein n=2 Tax=Colletotrichum acutatum species complex TaxID=2707335 RepID=A0AAI9Y2M2_9PEZI|nr:hypothetical protein CMEL01_00920 [Colletotrichum melonis]
MLICELLRGIIAFSLSVSRRPFSSKITSFEAPHRSVQFFHDMQMSFVNQIVLIASNPARVFRYTNLSKLIVASWRTRSLISTRQSCCTRTMNPKVRVGVLDDDQGSPAKDLTRIGNKK